MEHHVWHTVFGLAGLPAVAVVMVPAARRFNFPYTVLLAVLGCVIGAAELSFGELHGLGIFGDFFGALSGFKISSEAIFFVFLPALIFESALSIDVRRLFDDIGSILLLAVIGLLISTIVVGYSLWAVSGFALVACLLVGAIVSATDPVAVVAIFKDLGAPKRLAILVEGESLLNDATAIVIFSILVVMLTGESEPSLLAGAWAFVKVFIGGILVGYVCARAVCYVIARLRNLPLAETTLTISLAYLSFIIAEHYLHVSGVMAVVTAALVVGSIGRTAISAESWHGLRETWEQLGFWANSLIFVLVGIVVPRLLIQTGTKEVVLFFVLLVAAFAARAAIIYGVLPLLRYTGLAERVNTGYKTVMFWGGLRGAVSLALALAIIENPAIPSDVQSFVGVLVAAFVLFTLFVNATTMGTVLSMFGLDKLSPAEEAIRDRAMGLSLTRVGEDVEAVAAEYQINPNISQKFVREYETRVKTVGERLQNLEGITQDEWIRIGLAALGNQERKSYLDFYAKGYVGPNIARLLLDRIDDILDGLKHGGVDMYRQAVDKSLAFDWRFRLALYLHRRFGLTDLLSENFVKRFEVLSATIPTLTTQLNSGLAKVGEVVGDNVRLQLKELLEQRLAITTRAFAALELQYPQYSRTLKECHLGRLAVRLEESNYRSMYDEAVISSEVFKNLEIELEERLRLLEAQPRLDLGLDAQQLVSRVPFFESLDDVRIAEIAKLLRPSLVVPDEQILKKGEVGECMYFIASGVVEVGLEPEPVSLGSGEFFGEMALINEAPRVANVTAKAFCDLLILENREFHTLLEANPEMRATIYEIAGKRLGVTEKT